MMLAQNNVDLSTWHLLPPKTLEEHLFFLIYQVTPSAYELSSYNSQIRRLMAKDLEPNQFYAYLTYENLKSQLWALYEDTNSIHTHLITRAFTIMANIFNLNVGKKIALPNPELGLIENLLFLVGKKHTDRFLIQKVTHFMIHWMDKDLENVESAESHLFFKKFFTTDYEKIQTSLKFLSRMTRQLLTRTVVPELVADFPRDLACFMS